jgi:hypothetical protein
MRLDLVNRWQNILGRSNAFLFIFVLGQKNSKTKKKKKKKKKNQTLRVPHNQLIWFVQYITKSQ